MKFEDQYPGIMGKVAPKCFEVSVVGSVRKDLLAWYDRNHRVLPWRRNVYSNKADILGGAPLDLNDQDFAYRVMVSEVMLQQTQVARVVHYFEKWVERWPTLIALSNASEAEVNEQWAGLGYYRRARFLRDCALHVAKEFDGKLPQGKKELLTLPGFGPYI